MPIMPRKPLGSAVADHLSLRREIDAKISAISDPTQKVECARTWQLRFPRDPYANHVLAKTLAQCGHEIEAMSYSRVAIQISNFELEYTCLLIEMYLNFFFYEQIEPYIVGAQKRGKTDAEFESVLGRYYEAIGRSAEAITHFRTALSQAVTEAAKNYIKLRLAHCLRNTGENSEAQNIYYDLLRTKSRADSLAELSQILRGAEAEKLAAEIKAEVESNSELDPRQKEILYLSLGNHQEKLANYDKAFEYWKTSRSFIQEKYDPTFEATFIKDQRTFFNKELYERTRPYSNLSEKLIFVIGMPRSGTTLVAQILGSHKDIASAGELVRLVREAQFFVEKYYVPRGLRQFIEEVKQGELAGRTEDFLKLAELVAARPARRIVDKTPHQFHSAGYIHMCFPRAKFINLNRHPADIFISTYQNNFPRGFSYGFAQESFAHYFLQRELLLNHWKSLFPELFLDIKYEDLARDPEPHVRRMLDFLGLDWDPACMKFFERPSMVQTFSRDQVRSAINTKSVARWKNYEKHLGPLFAALEAGGYSYPDTSA